MNVGCAENTDGTIKFAPEFARSVHPENGAMAAIYQRKMTW